jgi:hypothetical protein
MNYEHKSNEWERMWKEAAVGNMKHYVEILLEGLRKITKNLSE